MKFLYSENLTRKDRYFLYNYNSSSFRLVKINSCKLPDFEPTTSNFIDYNSEEVQRISISRSKRSIREISLCNNFTHFATLTVNSDFADRFSLDDTQNKLKIILHKIKRRSKDFAYIFITEKHSNGAFHFHGLVKGIDDLYVNSFGYLSSEILSSELGFNSFSEIKDYDKCCNYITKYITKDCIRNSHNQIYISSRGLKKADKIEIEPFKFTPSYKNDFVSILDFNINDVSNDFILHLMSIKELKKFF